MTTVFIIIHVFKNILTIKDSFYLHLRKLPEKLKNYFSKASKN